MGLFGMFLKDELNKHGTNSLFQPEKWKKGNDIYGVKGKGNSLYDIEDKADIYDKNAGVNRSGFYHSYWRGWTEVRVDRPGKPYTIERVYTAPWIRQDLSTRSYVLVRILYGVLIALSIALFALAMTRPIGSNYCWYVALFGMPSTILIFVVVWMFVCYAKAPRKMTLYEHKSSSVYLKRICLIFSIGLAATALSTVVYTILNTGDEPLQQLLNVLLDLLAAGCAFAVFMLERNMKYVDIPNTNQPPEGGCEIL